MKRLFTATHNTIKLLELIAYSLNIAITINLFYL